MTWQGCSTTVLQQPKKAQARLWSKKHFQAVTSPRNQNPVKDTGWWLILYQPCLGMIGSSKLVMMMIRVNDGDPCWSYQVVSSLVGSVLHDNTYLLRILTICTLPSSFSRVCVRLCLNILHQPYIHYHLVKSTLMIKIMISGCLPTRKFWVTFPVILPNYGYSNYMSGQRINSSPFLSSKKNDEKLAWKWFFLANMCYETPYILCNKFLKRTLHKAQQLINSPSWNSPI